MRKLTALLMASVFAATITVPARADDTLLRLGVGVGGMILGEVLKNSGNRKQPAPQRSAPASKNSSSSSRQSPSHPRAVASTPKPVPDENVRFVQQKLNDLGYTEVGGADGFWGGNSAKALGIFMKDNGIDGEPKASPEIIAALAKAKTRQEIADAKESAVAEANMPAAKVEDGIVHFGPKPDQQVSDADAEHLAAEDAVQPEDFTDEGLTPAEDTKTAVDTDSAPSEQETVAAPAPEPDVDIAATEAPEAEAVTAETPKPDPTPPAAEQAAEVEKPADADQKQEAVVETKDDDGPQEINGLTVSGDF